MKRMYSQEELEAIVRALLPVPYETHVYALNQSTSSASASKETTVYIVSNKDIASASDLVADDINGKVIGVNYYEDSTDSYDDIWVGLSHFSTNSSGVVTFHRIKDRNGSYAGITATNIELATLKTFTLTKLV